MEKLKKKAFFIKRTITRERFFKEVLVFSKPLFHAIIFFIHPIGQIRIWTPEHIFRAILTRTKQVLLRKRLWSERLDTSY
jgi:hypothetical protein